MARAEFEEKEYELAFGVELADGPARQRALIGAGQVLEKVLGYDAAADTGPDHVIWSVLRTPRPVSVRLVPQLWSPGATPAATSLPASPVSLILQYKRPEYLRGVRAAQWRLWREPYYRFMRSPQQHSVLRRLERNLGSEAVVRYAAPAFWQRSELEVAHLQRRVLHLSGFVNPESLGRHRVWTYIRPGIDGRPNPSGSPTPFETLEALLSRIVTAPSHGSELALRSNGISAHIRRVASAARRREPKLRAEVDRWVSNVERDVDLRSEQLLDLQAYASIVSLLHRMGASWHVADAALGSPLAQQ